jgi:hypothetical protein
MRSVYKVLVGKSEGKTPLARPRRRWEYNIKIYLQDLGWRAQTDLPQDRDKWHGLLNAKMNLQVP